MSRRCRTAGYAVPTTRVQSSVPNDQLLGIPASAGEDLQEVMAAREGVKIQFSSIGSDVDGYLHTAAGAIGQDQFLDRCWRLNERAVPCG